ncbi:Uncharacterized protein TPAR_07370 [Tolypocladium paradoxum]|uniref:non-specific serine/threonine protein kinase n=1 Tax=Tolypocladium paradoxum TaxID=94208 RepID=A0A2S4KQJ8_9HYPO|nr:Uncharacterized protein TPAR_07370 [Tolypocladium paradoxum]
MDARVRELEKRLRDAELRAEEAERQRQQEAQRTQPTTLHEYIEACHNLVSTHFLVERDRRLTSKGTITNPQDKLCPTYLKPWSDFLELQKQALGAVFSVFPTESRLFEDRHFLAVTGKRISKRPIADEKMLEHFLHNAIEDPVKSILDQMKELDEVKRTFAIGDGVIFENHPHALSETADEVVAERQTPSSPPRTPPHGGGGDSNQIRPDQICVYLSDTQRRIMIFVCEYKAPHKLTAPHLRAGLRPMNIYKDVVNRKTIPTSVDPEALFQYRADRLTAAAITQTRHYMVVGGLEYGLLTTGEAIVFLKIDWQEPQTLYYHLAEPGSEVLAHLDDIHSCAAVGQYLAFILMALGPPGQRREHGQEERQQVIKESKKWAQDFESTVQSIPVTERSPPPGSSAYEPTTYGSINRTPYMLRATGRRLFAPDHPDERPSRRDPSESSDDSPPSGLPDTPSPAEKRPRQVQATRRSERVRAQQQRGGEQSRQYCTQKCLLGLVNGRELDQECPNVTSHRRKKDSARHPVTHTKWLQLLYEQLERSLDDGIQRLDEGGARGVLFQVTLMAYGYTFVSKGTVSAFIRDLRHEAAVYERLRPVQGVAVPVFLGSIDLRDMRKVYYYDHRVYIVHLTFLSWGGLSAVRAAKMPLAAEVERALRSIHGQWVVHGDVREANVLVNPETQTIMIIDFERALLLQRPRDPLAPQVPNKRAWMQETPDTKKATDRLYGTNGVGGFQRDIMFAKGAFPERHSTRG